MHETPGFSKVANGHLYIATPTYNNSVCTGYVSSLLMTMVACTKAGIALSGPDFKGSPYVEMNRNWLAHRFLASSADTMLFLDDDISWDEKAVVALYESGLDLCGGAYPMKQEIHEYPVKFVNGAEEIIGYKEVHYLPGGFMMIRRRVFDEMRPHVRGCTSRSFGGEFVHSYFENTHYPPDGWVGEDVSFCNNWKTLGGKVWCKTDIDFGHQGPKVWLGNLADHLNHPLERAA